MQVYRRAGALFGLIGLLAAAPAHAEIEKFMHVCDQKICPFFRASITLPDGWVEDPDATRYFNAQFLLPKGRDFDAAQAKIDVVGKYNRNKKPIADFVPDAIADWQSRAKDAKITRLEDLPRGDGKPVFERRQFEAKSLKEQSYELQSVTTDRDNDGNEFIVTITLSANSRKALQAAQPAYLAILQKY
jgi:multidrug efflux pump subunit AcrB